MSSVFLDLSAFLNSEIVQSVLNLGTKKSGSAFIREHILLCIISYGKEPFFIEGLSCRCGCRIDQCEPVLQFLLEKDCAEKVGNFYKLKNNLLNLTQAKRTTENNHKDVIQLTQEEECDLRTRLGDSYIQQLNAGKSHKMALIAQDKPIFCSDYDFVLHASEWDKKASSTKKRSAKGDAVQPQIVPDDPNVPF